MSHSCAVCETNYLITGLSGNYFRRNGMLIESRNNKIISLGNRSHVYNAIFRGLQKNFAFTIFMVIYPTRSPF